MRAFPGPRRVQGLRKEELAVLAGVSPDYYSRLEQGRQANVSDDTRPLGTWGAAGSCRGRSCPSVRSVALNW